MTTKEEYIDLGLPSGNLWKIKTEEDYFTYDEAVEKFGNNLPSKDDFKELYDNCTWTWDNERKGIEFTSKTNGKKIFFKANGYRVGTNIHYVGSNGYYWSSTPNGTNYAYYLFFRSSYVYPANYDYRYRGHGVRLVQKPNTTINKPTNKNTMTTKEMIALMTAFDEGKEIQMKPKGGSEWYKAINPNWDWFNLDYRIKPEEPKKESNNICGCSCGDNRFEIIKKAKQHLLESTNISSSDDEMKVLDTFLFRCWQMGWLKIYEGQSETIESAEKRNQLDKPEEPKPKYRPYTYEELKEAIKEKGLCVTYKDEEKMGTTSILSFFGERVWIYEPYFQRPSILWQSVSVMLDKFTWLDGTPFGIKE